MTNLALSTVLISIFFSCTAQTEKVAESEEPDFIVNRSTPQDSINPDLDSADIDFQFRGQCYAFNSKKYSVKSNGEAHSSNLAQKIDDSFTDNKHYLFLNTAEYENTTGSKLATHKLYLVNTTNSKIEYGAQDSRLNIVAQAKDEHGEWKAISYLPSSWCGNSYHTVTLGKNEYWSFSVPVFKGSFETKLRYVLIKGGENLLVSNEIDVLINPNQFDSEKKQGHNPQGIMDPYDD